MKVVSYEHLFGDNEYCLRDNEKYMVKKDGVKYMPLDVVEAIGFSYEQYAVQEVEI